MDEIATNAHNHRKKLIADKLHYGRLFQKVNAGDNKMPFISVCASLANLKVSYYYHYLFVYVLMHHYYILLFASLYSLTSVHLSIYT